MTPRTDPEHTSSSVGSRHGVALPLALFTIVILAMMITAAFYVARLELRMGTNSMAIAHAFEAAETGLAGAMSSWNRTLYSALPQDSFITLPTTVLGPGLEAVTTVRRLSRYNSGNSQADIFLIQSEGRVTSAGRVLTRRQVGRLTRLRAPTLSPRAAVTTRTGVLVSDTPDIDGDDHTPPAWGGVCSSPGSSQPGIRDSSGIFNLTGACSTGTCIDGSPDTLQDPTIDSDYFTDFGNETYASLASIADKVVTASSVSGIGPVWSGSTCTMANPSNWGDPIDPSRPCGDYFPIIHATGDLSLDGGWGQGLLLVDGNLILGGTARFYGVVIVQGSVTATNGEIYGAVMAKSDVGTNTIAGTITLFFSRCARDRAVAAAARPVALRDRSWAQLY